jgi:hypothetical protein
MVSGIPGGPGGGPTPAGTVRRIPFNKGRLPEIGGALGAIALGALVDTPSYGSPRGGGSIDPIDSHYGDGLSAETDYFANSAIHGITGRGEAPEKPPWMKPQEPTNRAGTLLLMGAVLLSLL